MSEEHRIVIPYWRVEEIIRKSFGRRFTRDCNIVLEDDAYYCPPKSDVTRLLRENSTNRKKYAPDIYDCDDFAFTLKYCFIKDAYRNKERRYPHCFGIIMGGKLDGDEPHAINLVITNKLKLFLVDPQTDRIFKPKKSDRLIYFVYI